MKRIQQHILLPLLFLIFSFTRLPAQFYKSEAALQQAWPELVSVSGFWGNSYSTYRYYVGDINDDKLPDIISFVQTYVERKPEDERVIGMEVSLSRGKGLFKRITIPRLFPYYGFDNDEPVYIYIAHVLPVANGFVIQVKDKNNPVYRRDITIVYSRNDNQLKIVKDGGKAVLGGINEEIYLTADDIGERDITDLEHWDYIDQYIPRFKKETGRQSIVVKSRDEFFAALGDHRDIILDMDVLDLSRKNIEKYTRDISYETGVGSNGVFSYFTDLHIRGKHHVDIIVDNDVDDVFRMDGCKLITLENLNFYHLVPAGAYCAGIVVQFSNSNNITMRNCQFNGSGMVGITLNESKNIIIDNCKIYNNSSEAISFYNSDNVTLTNTEIYRNRCESNLLGIYGSTVQFSGCNIHDNYTKERIISPPSGDASGRVDFHNVRFAGNEEGNESGRHFYFPGDDESTFTLGEDFYGSGADADEATAAVALPAAIRTEDIVEAPVIESVTIDVSPQENPVRESLIRNFVASEDSRDMNAILSFLSPSMTLYWEQYRPTKEYLKKTYASSWKALKTSSNTILGIRPVSPGAFVLHTYFEYTAQTGKKGSKESYVEFIFDDNNKIISIKAVAKP